ncbi:MAG TPA: PIG-L family deacetylase [Terriglobales bacterium]|nr:PIG-L family deacetylase [Terriglobales bacterium]
MRLERILALLVAVSIGALAQNSGTKDAPRPDDRFKADLLLVVAHPDDETGATGYLAQLLDQGKRVAVVYMTHGEAGHNNMGTERGVSLGTVREMELRHALTQLGIQNVWFLGGKDTPSQDVLQSLGNWGHGARLEEVVRMIRLTRPAVILTWLPGVFIGENHGDHQAAGVIATEAFDLAGNPAAFPAQLTTPRKVNETLLEGLQPWQPQKLYFFSDARDDKQFKGKGPEYATTAISPTRHLPYWRIAMDGFRFHRTQYRSYIEKLDKMDDQQLAKLATEQDGWASPLTFIFGKADVPSTLTGDIFEGVTSTPVSFAPPIPARPVHHSGLSVRLGGPWGYYDDFRPAHGVTNLPQAPVPEIGVAVNTTLQIPLILHNDTREPADIALVVNLPEGWVLKQPISRYHLAPSDVFPLQIELTVPTKTNDKPDDITCQASSAGKDIGTVHLHVRVQGGGLPQ